MAFDDRLLKRLRLIAIVWFSFGFLLLNSAELNLLLLCFPALSTVSVVLKS